MKTHPLLIRALTKHGFTLTLLLTLWGAQAYAQYDLLNQTTSDAVDWSRALAVADDGVGNSFMAGEFRNTMTLGSFTLTNFPLPTGPDNQRVTGYIAKYNSNSTTWVWATQIVLVPYSTGSVQNLGHCSIQDMTRDNNGNVYITGSYHGKIKLGSTTLTSLKKGAYPTIDIFVAKLNANGSFAWAKSLGSKDGHDFAGTIALDGSNNVVIGGTFAGKNSSCGYESSSQEIYVAKLTNAGSVQWEKKYKRSVPVCNHIAQVKDLSIDPSGNILICGAYSGTFSFGNGSALSITSVNETRDAFVAKLNSSGTTQWVRSAGGTSTDEALAIHLDAFGNSYIAGGYGGGSSGGSGITFGTLSLPGTAGSTDPFVAKYNASGTPLWAVNPNPDVSSISRIVPHSGALLIADGRSGFQTLALADGSTLSTVPFEGNGPLTVNPDMTGLFTLMDLEVAGSGYLFTLYGRCGTISIGGTALNSICSDCPSGCSNLFDHLLVRTGSGGLLAPPAENPIGDFTIQADLSHEGFEIFPNPAESKVVIRRNHSGTAGTFTLHDQMGRLVLTEVMLEGQRTATIDLDQVVSGIYFVNTIENGIVYTQRLMIAR